jgi:phage tail sheath gpL-like
METVLSRSFIAAADYSTTGQYRFVYLSAADTVTLCGAGTMPIGILQNNPVQYAIAEVMLLGISRLSVSAACALMARLESAANGQGVTTTTDKDNVAAVVIQEATDANDVVRVLLTPGCMYAG